jgi:tetraacyldisaccharide 4'-kinase
MVEQSYMFLIRILLFPFAVLYDAITRFRNLLYDIKLKPSASFEIPLISVGNLAVGGTGKTPMVEHLIRLFEAKGLAMATLSRGYGRKTKGMRLANHADTAETIGDEPYQLFDKYHQHAVVSVCEERAYAIPFLVDQFPDLKVIIMDDAFQHRAVRPGFSMVLTEYSNPFYQDFVMPAGKLRESCMGIKRADMVIVTKCPPDIDEEEMIKMEHAIRSYEERPVFFTTIRYGEAIAFDGVTPWKAAKVVLVSGLANAESLTAYVKENYNLVHHFDFPDHYAYTHKDWVKIDQLAKKHEAVIITTEKDRAKLRALASADDQKSLFYLPIEIDFIKGGTDFDSIVLDYVKNAESIV